MGSDPHPKQLQPKLFFQELLSEQSGSLGRISPSLSTLHNCSYDFLELIYTRALDVENFGIGLFDLVSPVQKTVAKIPCPPLVALCTF